RPSFWPRTARSGRRPASDSARPQRKLQMRPLLLCLVGLAAFIPDLAFAQTKQPAAKSAASGPEIRYFTAIDGLMDGNADVILKETRQGKTVTTAVLDVCYPVTKGAERKDRFVANLTISGQSLTG